jgi:hypothetical protein
MNILIKTTMVFMVFCGIAVGQFRSQPEARSSAGESLLRPDDGGLLFGWFDPSRLTMHNSYTLSYTTSGSKGYSLGELTSNIAYQISDPLSVQFDVSLLHSPFNNLGGNFANNISGIYLTRAELNYRPSKTCFSKFSTDNCHQCIGLTTTTEWVLCRPTIESTRRRVTEQQVKTNVFIGTESG